MKIWYKIIFNTVLCIIGIGIIPPVILSFLDNSLLTTKLAFNNDIFTQLFVENIYFVISIVPITLLIYDIAITIRNKRELRIDRRYQKIQSEVTSEGPGKFSAAFFPEKAFRIGEWIPVHVVFQHTWKASRSYEIESISSSRIYPHFDKTPVLNQGEEWTHIMYVLPLKQRTVDVKVRLTPSHTKQFKTLPKNQTTIMLTGKAYLKRDILLIAIIFIGEIILFFFLFSIVWYKIVNFVYVTLNSTKVNYNPNFVVPWSSIMKIGLVETVFFIPFLVIMYYIQRPRDLESVPQELSFSQDISTHEYKKWNEIKTRQAIHYVLTTIGLIASSVTSLYFTYQLWITSLKQKDTEFNFPYSFDLFQLTMITLLSWSITLFIMNYLGYKLKLRGRSGYSLSAGSYIDSIRTYSQFKVYQPTEVALSVKNSQNNRGLRLLFKGNDTISPPMLELHVDPTEVVTTKLAITPMNRGSQNVLIVIYPLFDEDGKYLAIDDCRPLAFQNINFVALGETTIGITQRQLRTLKHLFGWGSLLASVITFTNQYIGVEEVINQWKESIPWLVTLQVPFLYVYYLFTNKFIAKIQTY